jgi:hypothetical protein
MLVGEPEEPLREPRWDEVERLVCGELDALALEPGVPVEDIDVLGAAEVGGARDQPGQLLLLDGARDAQDLALLDVGAPDGELGELLTPGLDLAHPADPSFARGRRSEGE